MALLAVGVVGCLPGCGPTFEEVLVVGYDANGTPVVGAVDCSFDDRLAAEVVSVRAASGPDTGREIWRVERPGLGRRAPEIGPPAPSPPEPRFVGGVEMVAIGDPVPAGGDVAVALADQLPDDLVVSASVFQDDPDSIAEVPLGHPGETDTYVVAFGDGAVASGLDAARAAARIDEECEDDDLGFSLTPVFVTLAVTLGALLLLAVPVGMLTARQYRRAGARAAEVAEAARLRAAEPPGS
ncbi:MAG TPA: hypothetical protein VK507_20755 [Iamia sp.]|nr:hypothetical protein [Iamia sp.]